jgi:hypothetical protein
MMCLMKGPKGQRVFFFGLSGCRIENDDVKKMLRRLKKKRR